MSVNCRYVAALVSYRELLCPDAMEGQNTVRSVHAYDFHTHQIDACSYPSHNEQLYSSVKLYGVDSCMSVTYTDKGQAAVNNTRGL
jgi:hypothetical protein